MRDVRGYEEGDERVLGALSSGYPRFVTHGMVRALLEFHLERLDLAGCEAVLVPGRRAAAGVLSFDGVRGEAVEVEDGVYLVFSRPGDGRSPGRMRKFLQHTGCGLGSRQAEDFLVDRGLIAGRFPERATDGNALSAVEGELSRLYGCRPEDVLVCASGMNAFFSAYCAVRDLQRARGRRRWLQVGWLYLDSGCVLREFAESGESLTCVYDPADISGIEAVLAECGDELAGVVVEVPTNPLVQWCDLERLQAGVSSNGGVLIADPTMASPYNVDVLPYVDVLVNSLTKYAAVEGDVMAGALALNRNSPFFGELVARIPGFHLPLYGRDCARLAFEMGQASDCVSVMSWNASELASWLDRHPAIAAVHHAGASEPAPSIARNGRACGAVVTIELKGEMERVYDRLRMMKGPSFGTRFTLVSPFLYLAHYDLVTSKEGRQFLRGIGLNPELLRVSVGTEPVDDLIAAFDEALAVLLQP